MKVGAGELPLERGGDLLVTAAERQEVGPGGDAFWSGVFAQAGAPVPQQMELFWGWNATGAWEAGPKAIRRISSSALTPASPTCALPSA